MRETGTVRARSSRVRTAVAVLAGALLLAGCASGTGAAAHPGQINLVAYSTPQQVYGDLIPEFNATPAGKGAQFHQSYGASGTQARAVIAGQPADVVEFSLEPDMTKLVQSGVVGANWNQNPYHGMVTDSVVVLAVRKGNPKGIHGWDDLTKPGVKVVTPNPFSSGSAQWNLIAAYGAQLKEGKSPDDALNFVKQMLQNTVSQPDSGSKATQAFVAGTGDVLIAYENEAIEAQQANQPVDFVIPDQTILIENPIAVTSSPADPAAANAFVQFLYTDQAQQTFSKQGYRPVVTNDLDRSRFPQPPQLFTIGDLGGWPKVTSQFFDPNNGSISKIENQLGVHGG